MPKNRSKPPGKSLVAVRLEQARTYILQNPTHSKSQCVLATGCSDATVARARRDLILEGLLAPPRNAAPRTAEPGSKAAQPTEAKTAVDTPPPAKSTAPAKGSSLLDHAALVELAKMIDDLVDAGDDETIHRRLIKQCLTFAFRPDLHPDTRMSASQMYGKLRDMARAKELGPGKPKTFTIGVERLTDLLIACGPEMAMASIQKAFTVKEEANAEAQNDQAAPASGTPQASSEAGHESSDPPAEVVRPIDVEVRGPDSNKPNEGVGDHYLPGL